jgi:hypothetical protein
MTKHMKEVMTRRDEIRTIRAATGLMAVLGLLLAVSIIVNAITPSAPDSLGASPGRRSG